ncbi:MAG: hypothetical protein AMS24_04140 [Chlamydiae bacterium SM23_39]|nr:MAG: hypothetical protein AMS24_04140 [Chlamydiae bacterium SM23_39]
MLKKYLFVFFGLSISLFGKTTTFIPNENGELITKNETNKFDLENNFQEKFPKPDFQKAFLKMVLSLIFIIFFACITFWVFKRISKAKMSQANNLKTIKILEKRILSPKTILYLAEYEGTKILISESHLDVKMKITNQKTFQKTT